MFCQNRVGLWFDAHKYLAFDRLFAMQHDVIAFQKIFNSHSNKYANAMTSYANFGIKIMYTDLFAQL